MSRKLGLQVFACITIFLLAYTTLLPIVQSVPPVPQETWIVDISGNGDYISVQDAIDNANANDIIRIKEGTYVENSIEIHKKLTIVGDNQASTIIDCGGNKGFILDSSHVDIRNLKLMNPGEYAIYVKPGSDWCNISQVTIEAAKKNIGIRIRASSVVVFNCSIIGIGSTGTGIELQEQNNIIKNSNIYGFTVGVLALVRSHDHKILNCNIFNNEIAVDIRVDSHDNLVSKCNIYVNDLGIYIWQNSNNNSVYLNNFWKNDVAAIDECNNTWDNGEQGNYWDQYTGIDVNGDGIGDTSYTISEENVDRFPLTSMILPDEITIPAGVRHVSSRSDNTPSFTWSPSVYSKGVKGYYVKIDISPEIYVGDITNWTSSDNISDGLHTFYVRAEGTDDTISGYSLLSFSIDTTFIDTDGDGWSDEEEQQYGTDLNNADNYPLDTDDDHLPDSADVDDDGDSYSDDMELSYGTSTIDANSFPTDTDGDGVPDEDSLDGAYTGDVDDDDDSLVDTIETKLGSNPQDGSDVTKIYINGKPYYLVDISASGVYDVLYNPSTGATTAVERYGDKYYRLDINGDNAWDYIYQPSDGSIVTYTGEQPDLITIDTILIILSLALTIFLIFFYLFKIRPQRYEPFRKPLKIKKHPIHRKPLDYQPTDAKDTVEMIGRTRVLLQHIHEDVQVYMDQLSQMQEQLTMTTMKPEETPEEPTTVPEPAPEASDVALAPTEQVPEKPTKETDVDSEVDQLLSRLEKKEKT